MMILLQTELLLSSFVAPVPSRILSGFGIALLYCNNSIEHCVSVLIEIEIFQIRKGKAP